MEKRTVLIVDNDEESRTALTGLIDSLGLAVESVNTAEDAMARADERGYDLILLGVRLPDMNGLEALQHLRENHPHIPVIQMTSRWTIETIVASMKRGAVDFLEKPFRLEHVKGVVGAALNRQAVKADHSHEYEAFLRFAKHCIDRNDLDDTIEHLKTAISVNPSRPEAFNLLGAAYEIKRDNHTAANYYRASAALDLSYAPANHNLQRLTMAPHLDDGTIEYGDIPGE